MPKQPVTVRSGELIDYLESDNPGTFTNRFNKMVAVCRAVLNCKAWKISENNILFDASSTAVGAPASSWFAITRRPGVDKSLGGDYVICNQVTGFSIDPVSKLPVFTTKVGDVYIAKQVNMRKSRDKEWDPLGPVTYTFTTPNGYDADNQRHSVDSGNNAQEEYCEPRYVTLNELQTNLYLPGNPVPNYAQCIIEAEKPDIGTGVFYPDPNNPTQKIQAVWQEKNSNRQWVTPS